MEALIEEHGYRTSTFLEALQQAMVLSARLGDTTLIRKYK
jgi:hypothetical protein